MLMTLAKPKHLRRNRQKVIAEKLVRQSHGSSNQLLSLA